MTDTLAIRLSSSGDDVDWLLVDDTGAARGSVSSGPLADAARQAGDRPVLVLLDDVAVTRTVCDLPVSGRKLAQALPYALEDQFAGDVDDLHFGAGDANDAGIRPVAALDESTVAEAIGRLESVGIEPQRLHTWHDAIGPLDGFVQLLVIGDQVLICDADGDIAALRGLAPDDVLEAWRAGRDEDAAEDNVRVYYDGDAAARFANAFEALSVADADLKRLPDGILPFAARHILSRGGVNLLQGAYARRSNVGANLRPWTLAAALAGLALVLSVVGSALELRRLEQTSARLDGDMTQLLQQVQPGVRVTNPEGQLGARVRIASGASAGGATAVGDGAAFLPTLTALAGAMQSAGAETRIDAISFRGGIFNVRLTTPSAQTLDGLTQRVADAGDLRAQIQRTEQDGDVIKSFIEIRGAGE